jgi:hypothetical protein
MSFDLGVQGDYESLYAWLDEHKAKECGDSLACFWYEHTGNLVQSLKSELKRKMRLTAKSRFYVVNPSGGPKGGPKGSFVIGNRKNSPWTGFAGVASGEDTDIG